MRKGHENTHWRHMSHSSAKYQRFNNGPSCKFESLLLTKNGVEERESVQKSENPLRVVMVDDDPDDIFITKALAKRSTLPIDFKGFESGNALFKYIEDNGTEAIDLILLDINMPKPCGYDIVSRLRKCSQHDEITICNAERVKSAANIPHAPARIFRVSRRLFFVMQKEAYVLSKEISLWIKFSFKHLVI